METQEVVNHLDELIFSSTGRHLDSLQFAILKGVLKGQKYAEIAQEYKCSPSYAKDEARKLWKLLSTTLDEDINKSNFRATIERLGFGNFKSPKARIVGNRIRVNNINLCSNTHSDELESSDIIPDEKILVESIQKKLKRETIPRLVKLGLTSEQIAEALELSVQEVSKIMS